jgi:polysaccharide export outer membrane protein
MRFLISVAFIFALLSSLSSCKYYKQDILVQADSSYNWNNLKLTKENADRNYFIRKNDWIEIQVFTNKGELILDPNADFSKQVAGGIISNQFLTPGSSTVGSDNTSQRGRYLVGIDGYAVIPLIGKVKLDSLTYRQADSLLAVKFSAQYQDPYIITRATNRRVYFLASPSLVIGGGGGSQGLSKVIPLQNENANLLEVIASAGGIPVYGNASKIRIIRGNLKKPQVQVVDLSSVQGMMNSDLKILPGDIIIIEPGRRMILDTTRDLLPLFTAIISVVSLLTTTIILLDR